MKPGSDHKYMRVNKTVVVLLIVVLVLGAGFLGWWFGRSNESSTSQTNNTNQFTTVNNANTASVKSLVSYIVQTTNSRRVLISWLTASK